MTKLKIDGKEYEIEDEVSDLIVMISKERDGLKDTLIAQEDYTKDDRKTDEFKKWLNSVCFQKPTPEAYDLAKDAWKVALMTKTDEGAEVLCSVGLSDVFKLLEKDLKINQQLADKYKAKTGKEMKRQFQLKRRHTRDLIKQIKALGR